MRLIAFIIALTLISPALAEDDQAALIRRALDVISAQRNQALGDAAVWQAKALILTEELQKASAKIKELEQAKEKENAK